MPCPLATAEFFSYIQRTRQVPGPAEHFKIKWGQAV